MNERQNTVSQPKRAFVYIMMNPRRSVLYTGMTTDLVMRVWRHKQRTEGFTAKYNAIWLAYYEELDGPTAAIIREKQLKGLTRAKKLAVIKAMNPLMVDLSADWYGGIAAGERKPYQPEHVAEESASFSL